MSWSLFIFLATNASLFAEPHLPGSAPPPQDNQLVKNFEYLDDAAAQKSWRPMTGTAPVSVVEVGDRKLLKMSCNFKGTQIERASWDLSGNLDLNTAKGLQFKIFCRDISPVSHFTFYLQSGKGWYSHPFSPHAKDGWGTVNILKQNTRIEGTPAGWGKIETIRISAWRGQDQDTEFFLSDLAVIPDNSRIVLLRGESIAEKSADELKAVYKYTSVVARFLDDLGISYSIISDNNLTQSQLEKRNIVILPHNPQMPEKPVAELEIFIKNGGKLIAFYTIPQKLKPIIGIEGGRHVRQSFSGQFASIRNSNSGIVGAPETTVQNSWNIHTAIPIAGKSRIAANWYDKDGKPTGHPAIIVSPQCIHMTHVLVQDDVANKRRLLLSMLGHFDMELWKQAAQIALDGIGQFGAYRSFKEASAGIRVLAGGEEYVINQITSSARLRKKAEERFRAEEFVETISISSHASVQLLQAWCSAQKPQKDEWRGFWCHDATGVRGMTWDEAVRILAENGFTAVVPNMLWGGTAYYKSKVLPISADVNEKGDQIALCVSACKKYNLECHVWKVNWNMSLRATKEFMARMKTEGRIQVSFNGGQYDSWLCPSHPDNQKLEIDSMVEVASNYDVDGLHFDYIRYPGREHCFCQGCRSRFEKLLGKKIGNWPAEVRSDADILKKWNRFRQDNITEVVKAVSETARKLKPSIKISAAVFRNYLVDRIKVGQDWKLWCEKGYLDFVCPMDYTTNNLQFENMVKQQLQWSAGKPCYPGIGLSTWQSADVVKLIQQIQITRRLKTSGFMIFNYSTTEANDIVPLCGKGITSLPKHK